MITALPSDRATHEQSQSPLSLPTVGIPSAYRRDKGYSRPKGWTKLYERFFPQKTCPASRHTYMICDFLRDPRSPVRRLLIDAGYEPDHWASSIEVTLVGLWEARQYMEWETLPPTRRYKYNGHWVPIASGIEAGTAKTVQQGLVHESPQDAPKTTDLSDGQSL